MRKIIPEYENPFDNLLIELCEYTMPLFRSMNCTPNTITTFSLISGLVAVYALFKGWIELFVVFYLLQYFFDVADGHYARTYKMVTQFGDLYDHGKDLLVHGLILYVLVNRYSLLSRPYVMGAMILFWILQYLHLGCQEKIYSNKSEYTLKLARYFCLDDAKDTIKFTRYIGTGTSILITLGLIVYLHHQVN